MSEERQDVPEIVKDYRFAIFIVLSVLIALMLVFVALGLYNSSGTSQLDLTRPGYEAIRQEAKDSNAYKGFSSSGSLNKKALDDFDSLYTEKLKEAQSVDAFANDVLSFESLQIDAASAQKATSASQ